MNPMTGADVRIEETKRMTNARSVVLTAALVVGFAPGFANAEKLHSKRIASPAASRDCTPINGRYGYYGNPWCDTGSYRQEDIEYRERQRMLRKSSPHIDGAVSNVRSRAARP